MIPIYYSWKQASKHFLDHPDETCVVCRRRWYFFGWLDAKVHCLQQAAEFYGKPIDILLHGLDRAGR